MKKKIKIVFEVDIEYNDVNKATKRLLKDFNNWIKYDTTMAKEKGLTPILYLKRSSGAIEHTFNSKVKATTYVDGKKILVKEWEENLKAEEY